MRYGLFLAVLCCLLMAGCGKSSGAGAPEVREHAPKGDPASLPKVAADESAIAAALKDRFGDAAARNIVVEVEDFGGGKKVTLSGEVVNDEIRQAIMKELEARVPEMKSEDFRLELAGPVRQVFRFPARVGQFEAMAFSHDLSVAVTHEGDVYEMATGRMVNRMGLPDPQLFSMAISPDGKTLATGHQNGGIVLWEMPLARNPKTLAPFANTEYSQRIAALAFTSDSKSLVSVNTHRGEVVLWELASGRGRTIGAHTAQDEPHQLGDTYILAVSPDGKLIASGNADQYAITVWDVAARAKKMELGQKELRPEAIAWSHSGKLLAVARNVGDRRGVSVYDMASGKSRLFSREQDDNIPAVAFSPDDRLLAVEYDAQGVGLWDVSAGKEWLSLDSNRVSSGTALMFSPDGAVLATSCQYTRPASIRLWDVSKHPGAGGAAARMPAVVGAKMAYNDRMMLAIETSIRQSHPPQDVQSIHATLQADGSIELTGKVSDSNVKAWAQETAERMPVPDTVGAYGPNKVINKLEVTGRRAP
jgi:WD40 repeat protein